MLSTLEYSSIFINPTKIGYSYSEVVEDIMRYALENNNDTAKSMISELHPFLDEHDVLVDCMEVDEIFRRINAS